ncbi:hypothetical protein CHH91_17905, partial [Virgibacillus sp. 7505]
YEVVVGAVAKSDEFDYEEEKKSDAVIAVPRGSNLPNVDPEYDLGDVGNGVSTWFNALWLIVAFSVSIPLALMVSRRIKELFFA